MQAAGHDIRGVLRRDHEATLEALDALRSDEDASRGRARLRKTRRSWVVHALAEEAVVYRALEGAGTAADESGPANRRIRTHDKVDALFQKLDEAAPGTPEWRARVGVVRQAITRHIETEQAPLIEKLGHRFDGDALDRMGEQFEMVREKLALLEEAKGKAN